MSKINSRPEFISGRGRWLCHNWTDLIGGPTDFLINPAISDSYDVIQAQHKCCELKLYEEPDMNKKRLLLAMALPAAVMVGCGAHESRVSGDDVLLNQPVEGIEASRPLLVDKTDQLAQDEPTIVEAGMEPGQRVVDEQPAVSFNEQTIAQPEIMQFYFATNADQLHDDDLEEIAVHASYLKSHPHLRLKITGYTDQSGSSEYNQKLALKRADGIANALVKYGVMPEQISIYSQGEMQSITGLEHAIRDRRVEFEYYDEMQLSDKQVY